MTQEPNIFPYIARLLQGAEVVWKPLGEVAEIKTGQTVSKNIIAENTGNYPVINSGREPLGFINTWNTDNDPIGITSRGAGVGSVTWQEGKYFRGNLNYSVSIYDSSILDTRFLYHLLLQMQIDIQALCTFQGIPALNAANLKKLSIPLPPLSVQQEIVRILDKFTQLEAELEAELDCRKRQYEYYRNKLLSYEGNEVEWKTLGEVGEIRMCKRILKEQTSDYGEVPFYKIGTFGKEADAYISKELFNEYRAKYNYPNVGDILISASGTIGRTVIFDGKEAYFQDSNIVWIENDQKKVLNKYLFYCYQIAKWNISEGGTILRLYNENLRKTLIPIPYPNNPKKSLEEQNRIVTILDKFDTLVNSISEGLPKEIALRKKQYEYYREQLLTFTNDK